LENVLERGQVTECWYEIQAEKGSSWSPGRQDGDREYVIFKTYIDNSTVFSQFFGLSLWTECDAK
jgi:hypothetical protein